MKFLLFLMLIFILSGCGVLGSGGTYRYHYETSTGEITDIKVDSVRELGPTKIGFSPDGTVNVEIDGVQPGPNNMGRALTIIDGLVKAGTLAAIP